MKKVLSLVLVLAMVLGTFSFAFAASDDITGHENEVAIRRLVDLGLVKGDSRGYRPDDTLTRAEAATLVVRALGKEDIAKLAVNSSAFSDVPTDFWAAGYINLASQLGYVNGYPDGTFRPNNTLTYNEALALMVKVLGYNPKAMQNGGWPLGYVVVADELGITDDTIGFADAPTTRANMFQMLDNSLTVDMMVQKGFGDDMTWEVEEDKNILNEIGFEQIKGERVIALDTKHDEIEFEEYGEVSVPEDFDYEEVFGLKLDAWVNEDGELVVYEVKDEPIFDAIEWDSDDEVLTAVFADEDYELADDVILRENGESVKVKNFDKDYDYAKIVLNDDDEVVFVDAYDWDNSIVVDEIDDVDVIGYGVDADEITLEDMDDYTIVKDGKTIALDDLEEGDIVYYNEDAEYAEVYNYSVEGEVTAVYSGDFDLDKDNYDIAGTYLQEGDDIEDIDVLDEDVLDDMKASEEDVEVFLDRAGNVRHVVGDLGEEDTTVVAGYVINDVDKITTGSRTAKYNVDVVTEEGKYVEYDVKASDFADANDDDEIKFKDDIDIIDAGDIVEITFDEDGDISEVAKVTDSKEFVSANDKDDDIDIEDDKYTAEGNRLKSSAIVFDISEYDDDTDDIVVSKYSDVDFDTIKEGIVYYNSNYDVTYIVVEDNGKEADEYVAFVKEVKKLSSGKYRTWVVVDGEEKYDDLSTKYDESTVVELDIDEDGNFSNIDKVSADKAGTLKDISRKDKTFTVGTTENLKLADEAYIFDTTDDNKELSFSDLEEGMKVEVYFDGNSKRYVEFLLVTEAAPEDADDEEVTTEGKVTFVNADEGLIEVDGKVLELDSRVRLVDADDNTVAIGPKAVAAELEKGDVLEEIVEEDGIVKEMKLAEVVEEEPAVDTSALEAKIAEAEALDKDDYTAETWADLEDALKDAKAALKADKQADVDAALKALEDAIAALEEVEEVEVAKVNVTYNSLAFGPSTIFTVTVNSVSGVTVDSASLDTQAKKAIGEEMIASVVGNSITMHLYNGETEVGTVVLESVESETTGDYTVTLK